MPPRQRYDKPFLLVDPRIVRTKARRFKAAMPRVQPHYAVKANPHPAVLRDADRRGRWLRDRFDRRAGPPPEPGCAAAEIYYSNPVKSAQLPRVCGGKGVEWYVLDSVEELRKIVSIKPDA